MKLNIYQVDAFTGTLFKGNPAAVVPLENWLKDETLLAIARENNLSETAFFIAQDNAFHLRWFTPESEVEICGHATLASAFILFYELGFERETIHFDTLSGELTVTRKNDLLEMDFPSILPVACDVPADLEDAIGIKPVECLKAEDYIVVLKDETTIKSIKPDYIKLKNLDLRGVAITAKSDESSHDFCARFFAPKYGINEDPVTGSLYCQLTPYWSGIINKTQLIARQLSNRGGEIICEMTGKRVKIAGKAIKYLDGTIYVPD